MKNKKIDFISLKDLSKDEILSLLELTAKLKDNQAHAKGRLDGKTIGLLFQKPSNRTRVSFDVGIKQLGGNCLYLGPDEINLGVRETISDVSKTLSRYLDGIVARTHTHSAVTELAQYASIPIINGLCDVYHPCQGLTDIFSITEHFGKLEGLSVAYVGDGNNVCHSLLLGCAKTGVNMRIATPKGYEPSKKVIALAKSSAKETGAKISIGHSPKTAVKGVDVIYADVWVSMGQETEAQERLEEFNNFQINKELIKGAKDNFIFMHCLPAHREEEVTAEVIDGKHSIVFDQAENRLHTQKAILIHLLGQ